MRIVDIIQLTKHGHISWSKTEYRLYCKLTHDHPDLSPAAKQAIVQSALCDCRNLIRKFGREAVIMGVQHL